MTNIKIYPENHLLKENIKGVIFPDKLLNTECRNLVELCSDLQLTGISAPEVGVNKRIICFHNFSKELKDEYLCLVNPFVFKDSGELTSFAPESCPSCPGETIYIERPLKAEIRGWLPTGQEIIVMAGEITARVLLHLIDHLNGVTILDYDDDSYGKFVEDNTDLEDINEIKIL